MKQVLLFKANIGRRPFIAITVPLEIIWWLVLFTLMYNQLLIWLLPFLPPFIYVFTSVQKARLNDAGRSGWWSLPVWFVRAFFLSPVWGILGIGVFILFVFIGYIPILIIASLKTADPATNKYYIPQGE